MECELWIKYFDIAIELYGKNRTPVMFDRDGEEIDEQVDFISYCESFADACISSIGK
jgi:hypothetical protein